MEDRDLEQLAKTLGARPADQLDVERVTAGVLAKMRADRGAAERRKRAWWSAPVVLRLAAAVAVLATGGVVARGVLERRGAQPLTVVSAPILRDLSADELVEVFDSLGIEAPVHEGLAVGLENLNEAQLQELLRLMEG